MNKKHLILLIDDEADYCALLKMHLSFIGNFEVVCADSGNNGLKLARRIKPDIILLDVIMPGLDGFAVLEKLKKDDETISIPVIMLTGLDEDSARIKAAQLYDELYITKPVDIYQLKSKIEEILKLRSR
jgi:DNA-binding response OmpR family regulator